MSDDSLDEFPEITALTREECDTVPHSVLYERFVGIPMRINYGHRKQRQAYLKQHPEFDAERARRAARALAARIVTFYPEHVGLVTRLQALDDTDEAARQLVLDECDGYSDAAHLCLFDRIAQSGNVAAITSYHKRFFTQISSALGSNKDRR